MWRLRMMRQIKQKQKGVTLIEILLVLAIMASLLILASGYMSSKISESRRDRMVLQMEQILNAGLAYYVNNGAWPGAGVVDSNNELEKNGYLPNTGTIMSPFSYNYVVSSNTTNGTFSLCTTIPGTRNTPATGGSGYYTSTIEAGILAGRLPVAYVVDGALPSSATTCPPSSSSPCNSESCTLVSQVNIPGQNLNNARSLNFGGAYHNGACVPAPVCPGGTSMTQSIYVVPAAVSGNSDGTSTVYPVSSFMAYAVGAVSTSDPTKTDSAPTSPNNVSSCVMSGGKYVTMPCSSDVDPNGKYWRVCLFVVTENGIISTFGNPNWTAASGSVIAVTRCTPTNEPSGSGFNVFTSY